MNLKVLAPVLVGAAAGLALVIVGGVLGDDTLRTIGVSVLGSALGLGGIGYRAPNKDVVRTQPLRNPRKHRKT